MIFIVASTEPTMILFLTEDDVLQMRKGYTRFVDESVTKGFKFDKILVSLHKDTETILNELKKIGHDVKNLPSPIPTPEKVQCEKCKSAVDYHLLFENKCILCWATLAKESKILQSGAGK